MIREYIFPNGNFLVKGKVMGFSGLIEVSFTKEYLASDVSVRPKSYVIPTYEKAAKIQLSYIPDLYSRLGEEPSSTFTIFAISAYINYETNSVAILVQEFDPVYNSFISANWITLPAYGIEVMYPIFSKNGNTYWAVWWYTMSEDYLDIYSGSELVTRINCSEYENWMYDISMGVNSTGSHLYIILGGFGESLVKVVDLSTNTVATYSIPVSVSSTFDFYLHIVSGEPLGNGHIIYTTFYGVSSLYILPAGEAYEITEFVGYTPYYTTYSLGPASEEFEFVVFDLYNRQVAVISAATDGSNYSIQYIPADLSYSRHISRVGNEFIDTEEFVKYDHNSMTVTQFSPIIKELASFATSDTNFVCYDSTFYILNNYVGSMWYPLYLQKEYAASQGYYYYTSKVFVVNYADLVVTYPRLSD